MKPNRPKGVELSLSGNQIAVVWMSSENLTILTLFNTFDAFLWGTEDGTWLLNQNQEEVTVIVLTLFQCGKS